MIEIACTGQARAIREVKSFTSLGNIKTCSIQFPLARSTNNRFFYAISILKGKNSRITASEAISSKVVIVPTVLADIIALAIVIILSLRTSSIYPTLSIFKSIPSCTYCTKSSNRIIPQTRQFSAIAKWTSSTRLEIRVVIWEVNIIRTGIGITIESN